MSNPTAEKVGIADRISNFVASLLLLILWMGAAWAMAYFTGESRDHWFMLFVAAAVALNLPGRRYRD